MNKGIYTRLIPMSIATRKKMSDSHTNVPKGPCSEQTKMKIRERLRGKPSGACGKHWKVIDTSNMKGHQTCLGKRWKIKDTSRMVGNKNAKGHLLTEKHKQTLRECRIEHPNRKYSNTIIEQKTAIELERRGLVRNIDFFQNFGLAKIKNVDFYLPKLNIVIECDGCFYHACKEHGNPNYHQHAIDNDAKQTALLEAAGYKVFRFWGHHIHTSAKECVDTVIANFSPLQI